MPPINSMDIKILAERAKSKDARALATLYKMYYPKMLGLCICITKEDEDTAKDLVHDAFVLAFSYLQNLNTPERFDEWLTSIVRNVALRYMERKGKICFATIANEEENIVDTNVSADSMVNTQDVLNLIDELPNGYGKVLRLYAIEGFTHKEIAEFLGIKPHSSSSQLSRAKAMLRKMAERRLWAVILLLIIPLYYFIFMLREKPLQPHNFPIIAEDDKGQKDDKDENNIPIAKKNAYVQTPTSKHVFIPTPASKNHDTIHLSDTTTDEKPVPDVQIAEHKQDNTESVDSIKPQFIFHDNEIALNDVTKKSAKWQMLAAGSLGPALVQNVYKLLATSGNIGDIEASTFPENVNTWEDYSRYLHMQEHENMSADTLAIMEIADHNQGEIIEKEQHDRPITFGISLSKPISERWSLETGLQYSLLKSRSTMGNGSYYIGKQQKIHYLGIPIRMSYRMADYKHLSAYGSAGVTLQIPIYGKVNSNYVVNNMSAYTDSWNIAPPVQWSTNFSIGVKYKFLPKWALYVEPTLYWHIPNGSSTHTIWTEHPVMFSVPFGIRFTW